MDLAKLSHCFTKWLKKRNNLATFCSCVQPIWINKIYRNWKYLESDVYVISLEISPDKLNIISKHIIDIYCGSTTAIISNDMSDGRKQPNGHNVLSYLEYNVRHHNFSLFILSQKLNSIWPGIRDKFFGYIDNDTGEEKIYQWEMEGCKSILWNPPE